MKFVISPIILFLPMYMMKERWCWRAWAFCRVIQHYMHTKWCHRKTVKVKLSACWDCHCSLVKFWENKTSKNIKKTKKKWSENRTPCKVVNVCNVLNTNFPIAVVIKTCQMNKLLWSYWSSFYIVRFLSQCNGLPWLYTNYSTP